MSENEKLDSVIKLFEQIIDNALQESLAPFIWRLEEVVSAFEDAADRLTEEQRRLDMMKSEMARGARRPNGQDAGQSQ